MTIRYMVDCSLCNKWEKCKALAKMRLFMQTKMKRHGVKVFDFQIEGICKNYKEVSTLAEFENAQKGVNPCNPE